MHPGFRFFILGAGFSRAAGLPLGSELYSLVKQAIEQRHGRSTKFSRDVERYIEYRSKVDGIELSESSVDLEELMSYLDIEHILELRGSDHWSSEGNESQLMIRSAIGEVIHRRTPDASKIPDVYYRFADALSTHDWVLTFNYDVLLERALEHIGKPFRRFPFRYSEIWKQHNTVDSSRDEVVLLKLHGSVDWFHDKAYLELRDALAPTFPKNRVLHSVFDHPEIYGTYPLAEGPRSPDDSLRHLHCVRNLDLYYSENHGLEAPFILSPSRVKFVYAEPVVQLWRGLGQSGGTNLGLNVIDFSLPEHDEYIRVGLHQLISNYQGYSWDAKWLGSKIKDYVRLVDFRGSEEAQAEYKKRYRFVEESKTRYLFSGFGEDAIQFLFGTQREA